MKVVKMNILMLILISVVLGVMGQVSLKQGLKTVGKIEIKDLATQKIFSLMTERYVLLGIVLYISATAIWLVVLSQEELSFAYPLVAIGYILAAVLGKIFFNESLTFFRIFGILLVMIGVYVIVLKI